MKTYVMKQIRGYAAYAVHPVVAKTTPIAWNRTLAQILRNERVAGRKPVVIV